MLYSLIREAGFDGAFRTIVMANEEGGAYVLAIFEAPTRALADSAAFDVYGVIA